MLAFVLIFKDPVYEDRYYAHRIDRVGRRTLADDSNSIVLFFTQAT